MEERTQSVSMEHTAGVAAAEAPVDDASCHPADYGAASFAEVKAQEEEQVRERRAAFDIGLKNQGDEELLGLAISGGGIRSATFSLGIIQRLAERGLLKQIDYLSTVSGGGYVGSWLYSWLFRAEEEEVARAATGESEAAEVRGFERVAAGLRSERTHESPEITFLRQYSNYLTPRVSAFSADTWVVGMIWARNTLLNVAILVAVIAAAVLAVRGLGLLGLQARNLPLWQMEWGWPWIASVGVLLPMLGCMGWNLWRNSEIALNSDPPVDRKGEATNHRVLFYCVSPIVSAILYSFWLGQNRGLFVEGGLIRGIRANFLALVIAFFLVQFSTLLWRCHLTKQKTIRGKLNGWNYLAAGLTYVYAPVCAAFVTAALLRAIALLFDTQFRQPQKPWFILAWGVPLVLTAFTAGMIVHIGLMGRDLPEASREWLGRLRGWLMIVTLGWVLAVGIAIYGPWVVAWLGVKSETAVATLGLGWVLSTAAGLFAGNSDKTNGKAQEGNKAPRRKSLLETVAGVAPYVFIIGFTVVIAFGVHAILVHGLNVGQAAAPPDRIEKYDLKVKDNNVQLSREQVDVKAAALRRMEESYWYDMTGTEAFAANTRWPLSGLVPLLGVLLVAGGLLAWRVDINVFSMHYFYKNRLVRCYLGASRQRERNPSPFTGFDDFDDTRLCRFTRAEHYLGPYPIMNAALNVTSGGKLQYQERQAQSFVFTPLYTGFSAESVVDEMRLADSAKPLAAYQDGASAPAKEGVGQARGYRPTAVAGGGASVGMAMAISGAAANPNMGYHTSLAVSFLLTVFNVRLGWWFGNALKDTFSSPGPSVGLMYSFRELFGMANADSAYVSLSDGGHFDNMGIYELVRRGCQYIICCDGEQDENLTFNGIGSAIRKCRTDFGVDIDLPLTPLRRTDGFSQAHCVVGRIKYPATATAGSSAQREATEGYILYLKSSLTGDEATDVLEYHARQPAFPHQTTGDQWFDESQFESYRKLGYHVADKALAGLEIGDDAKAREKLFSSLAQIWYPRSIAVEKNSQVHTEMYSRILDSVRREKELAGLDKDLFEAFGSAQDGWDHNSGLLCNSFIQLMERVFYDLELEDRANWTHPYVAGWLDIFRYWVKREPFQKAWAVARASYPERFCRFYESLGQQAAASAGHGH